MPKAFASWTLWTFHYYLLFVGPKTYLALLFLEFHFEYPTSSVIRIMDVQHYAFMNSYDNYSTDLLTLTVARSFHLLNAFTSWTFHVYCNVSLDSGCDLSLVPILFIMFVFEEYLNHQHLSKREPSLPYGTWHGVPKMEKHCFRSIKLPGAAASLHTPNTWGSFCISCLPFLSS